MTAVPVTLLPAIQRVAVIDDDMDQAEATSLEVEEAGFEPIVIRADPPFQRLEELAAVLTQKQVHGAVCDHRLRPRGFSQFNGAPFAAMLYDSRIPSVLVTQYVDMDFDVSIRVCRRKIPVVLSRDATDSESIKQGLLECAREIDGQVSAFRKPHRSLIRVTDIGNESNEIVLDVIIPSWNPLRAVRFPLSLIPPSLRQTVARYQVIRVRKHWRGRSRRPVLR